MDRKLNRRQLLRTLLALPLVPAACRLPPSPAPVTNAATSGFLVPQDFYVELLKIHERDTVFLAYREFAVDEIARTFRIPEMALPIDAGDIAVDWPKDAAARMFKL